MSAGQRASNSSGCNDGSGGLRCGLYLQSSRRCCHPWQCAFSAAPLSPTLGLTTTTLSSHQPLCKIHKSSHSCIVYVWTRVLHTATRRPSLEVSLGTRLGRGSCSPRQVLHFFLLGCELKRTLLVVRRVNNMGETEHLHQCSSRGRMLLR